MFSGGSSPACSCRYRLTQVPSVPSFTCISRATSAIGRDSTTTILTASSRNSGLNFLRFCATCSLRRSELRSYGTAVRELRGASVLLPGPRRGIGGGQPGPVRAPAQPLHARPCPCRRPSPTAARPTRNLSLGRCPCPRFGYDRNTRILAGHGQLLLIQPQITPSR
jgi:hypothetical protein